MERFAFVIHPLTVADFSRKFPLLDHFSERFVERTLQRLPPFRVSHITGVQSATGARAEGWFIGLPMTTRALLRTPFEQVLPKLVRAGRLAERLGAGILGLGSFTKVVGDHGVSVDRALRIPVTTGNSFTAASAVEGALMGAQRLGHDLEGAEVALIGATGAIGRACAAMLTGRVRRLVLVARRRDALEELRGRLVELGTNTEISCSVDAKAAAAASDIILTVSSAPGAILDPTDLRPGAVVCDVARPRNVSARVHKERRDVLVIDGGVIKVPGKVDFRLNFGLPKGHAEACIAETMILALERRYEPFTLGTHIQPERVIEIAELARKHGFVVSGFRRFERAIPEREIETIREVVRKRRWSSA